jgi:riboflavin biosynthesis pyrimidine reductase
MRPQDSSGICRLITVEDRSSEWPVAAIGNRWSCEQYDGPFHVFEPRRTRPAISLVFVQSKGGNTVADNPDTLGGGPTDKHLIYEGLSRVAADAVLAGAGSVGRSTFFTIANPELVALRLSLGLPRHPAQIVISNRGNVDLSSRLFSTGGVRVFLLAGPECVEKVMTEVRRRSWITLVPIVNGRLDNALARLRRDHRIGRISAVGGRHTATDLVDAGLVQDIYLTTTAIDGGEPNTPWYAGAGKPQLHVIVRKRESASLRPIVFEHLAISS